MAERNEWEINNITEVEKMTLLNRIFGRELSERELKLCVERYTSRSRNLLFEKVERRYSLAGDYPEIEMWVLVNAITTDFSDPKIMHSGEYSQFFRRRVYNPDGKLIREYIIGGIPASNQRKYSVNRFYDPPGRLRGKIISLPSHIGEITKL